MNTNIPKVYIRTRKGNPRGLIVATENGVGWSICAPTDTFSKDFAMRVAVSRANFSHPTRKIKVPKQIEKQFAYMQERRKRYYKIA